MYPLENEFVLPDCQVYLCGHSLGPLSRSAQHNVLKTLHDWGHDAVGGWTAREWFDLPVTLGKKIAPLIGAYADEVIVGDSTSVNLYKLLVTACALNADRTVILTDQENFPTDLYIAQGLKRIKPELSIRYINMEQIDAHLDTSIAVLMLSQVNYRSGYLNDLPGITARAHAKGIKVIWDLSHSVGILPIELHKNQVDFAVGCTYKYLNGGPGSPSFIFIHQKHHEKVQSPITGWVGHQAPFAFRREYEAASGVRQYNVGSPNILSLKALEGALEVFSNVDLQALRALSMEYSQEFIAELQKIPELECVSPLDPKLRGGHVAFTHPHAEDIFRSLMEQGLICDYREPGLIRMSFNPLFVGREIIAVIASFAKQSSSGLLAMTEGK